MVGGVVLLVWWDVLRLCNVDVLDDLCVFVGGGVVVVGMNVWVVGVNVCVVVFNGGVGFLMGISCDFCLNVFLCMVEYEVVCDFVGDLRVSCDIWWLRLFIWVLLFKLWVDGCKVVSVLVWFLIVCEFGKKKFFRFLVLLILVLGLSWVRLWK